MKEWFENWFDSPYYHILYAHRSDTEAIQFVEKLVDFLQTKPNDTLLDLACGKGRHARAFSTFGLDVTGVDLSAQSIAFAKQFEHEHLHFFTHDMRQTFRANYFTFVCNLFTSFGYFKSDQENQMAAKSMADALKSGGKLVVDFINEQAARKYIDANQSESIRRDGIQFEIKRHYQDKKLLKDITVKDKEEIFHFQESVNSFTQEDFIQLFTSNGLTCLHTFGDYHLATYDVEHSPRMICIFEKQ